MPTIGRPKQIEIKRARLQSHRTQAECARLIYEPLERWQNFESGRTGMHPGLLELFKIKAGLLDTRDPLELYRIAQGSNNETITNDD